jgi:1-acyl-sn-glycerol-3-phosphate acyltransferase
MLRALSDYFERTNPGVARWRVLFWELLVRPMSWLMLFLLYRHRVWGMRNVPDRGPVLLLSNHQSYLDLNAIGVSLDRRHFHSMARWTLFEHAWFAWLIRALNAFPVQQGKSDIKSIRKALELLNKGHLLLIFPEGSRTDDGMVHAFNPGLMLLIRRAKPTVVPMAVEGVHDAWAIHQSHPRLRGQIGALFGEPITSQQLLAMGSEAAILHLQQTIDDLRLDLRGRLHHLTEDRLPVHGPPDGPSPFDPTP